MPGPLRAGPHGRRRRARARRPHVRDSREAPGRGQYSSTAVLGSWVGARRPFQLSVFLTASRMVLPQDPSTNLCRAWQMRLSITEELGLTDDHLTVLMLTWDEDRDGKLSWVE